MKIILFVWKDGVIERFGLLGEALRLLGHEAVLALHPRSEGPVSFGGRDVEAESLSRLFDRHSPDCVVLWNGDLPMDEEVKAACRERAVPVLYSEMAWFPQADAVYFDWEGVNGSSSIRRTALPRLNPPRRRALESFLAGYRERMADEPPPPSFERDFILLPLQVETDSSILRYSPISSMAEFVGKVREVFPDEAILVRRHPKSPSAPAALPRGCAYASPSVGLHQMLTRAKAVVALNSTVALEALTYHKPVVAFGEGIFSGHGAVLEASRSTPSEMRSFVNAPLDASRRARIELLLHELIFNRSFYNRDLGNPAKVRESRFYLELLRLKERGAKRRARLRSSTGPSR